jgi:hypothetical protein
MRDGDETGRPPPLEYRSGVDERREQSSVPVPAQTLLGCFCTTSAVIAAGFVGAIGLNSLAGSVFATLIVASIAAAVAMQLRDNKRYRGWTPGIWLGLCFAGLIEGGCFMMLMS